MSLITESPAAERPLAHSDSLLSTASKELQKEFDLPKNEGPQTFMSKIFDRVGHLIVGIVLAYLFGYFGFHFSWIALTCYLVYKLDKRRLRKTWHRYYLLFNQKRKAKLREAKNDESLEKSVWLNHLLQKLWPQMSQMMAGIAHKTLMDIISKSLQNNKPGFVEDVKLADVSMGTTPLELTLMKVFPNTPANTFKMQFDFSYAGELELKVDIRLGGKVLGSDLSVIVRDLRVEGRINLKLDLAPVSPFIKHLEAQISQPRVSLSVKPANAFDVFDALPGLKNWFSTTIENVLTEKPIKVTLIADPDTPTSAPAETSAKPPETPPPTLKRRSTLTSLKNSLGIKNQDKEEVKLKETDVFGTALIKILKARRLISADIGGTSDPYVEVHYLGTKKYTTKVIQKTIDPIWNEQCEFPVSVENKKVVLKVFDHDQVGSNDFLGQTEVDLGGYADNAVHTLKLDLVDEKGSPMKTGTLQLEVNVYEKGGKEKKPVEGEEEEADE